MQNQKKKDKKFPYKSSILEKNPDVRFGGCDYTNIIIQRTKTLLSLVSFEKKPHFIFNIEYTLQ